MKYGAAVLAGGAGSRMGNINKAALQNNRETFLAHLFSELRKLNIPLYLSVARYSQQVPEGVTVVPDAFRDGSGGFTGPAGGICSCLQQAEKDGLDGLFFCPCDAPYFQKEMIEALKMRLSAGDRAVLWQTADKKLQTAFGYYGTGLIPVLKEELACGHYKLMRILEKAGCTVLLTEEYGISDRFFTNINTQEDYRALRQRIIAVCGRKNSGKTTLIVKLVSALSARGKKAAVIKHDGHDFSCDVPGTDSHAFTEAGAYGTAVFSAHRMFIHRIGTGETEAELIRSFPEADIILIEGLKDSTFPKIEVIRSGISDTPCANPEGLFLIVSDLPAEAIKKKPAVPVLGPDSIEEILEHIQCAGTCRAADR